MQHETELLEDSLAIPGLPSFPSKVGSSEEEFFDSDDVANSRPPTRSPVVQNPPFTEPKLVMVPTGNMRREVGRRAPHVRLPKLVRTYSPVRQNLNYIFHPYFRWLMVSFKLHIFVGWIAEIYYGLAICIIQVLVNYNKNHEMVKWLASPHFL